MSVTQSFYEILKSKLKDTLEKDKDKDKEKKLISTDSNKANNSTENPSGESGDVSEEFTIDEIYKQLEGIENRYSSEGSEQESEQENDYSVNLEKVEVPEIEEDKIKERVTNEIYEEYEAKKQNLQNQSEKATDKIEEQKKTLVSNVEKNKKDITEIMDSSKVVAENEALRRGLARSSIIILQLDGIEKNKAEKLSDLAVSLTDELNKLENEVRNLENELIVSLDNLDINHAMKINTLVADKIAELEKKQKEAIEYNNEVEKEQFDYNAKIKNQQVKDVIDEYKLKEEYGISTSTGMQDEKFDVVLKYLNSIPREEALKLLTQDRTIIDHLGKRYNDMYYTQVIRKS